MERLADSIDALAAETGFSGVVRIDVGDDAVFARAYGTANRATGTPNTVDHQFGIASGTKGLTAVTVVSLIEAGLLDLSTTARSVLGDALPLIADDVTVEQLLAYRSGIGDYLDEDLDYEIDDYLMPVSVHELRNTEEYLRVLDGHEHKFAPGEAFSYCNGGYVVLALLAERVAGIPFGDLVRARVCVPAGMPDTQFLESDELPGRAAIGYLSADGARTNVFHLPVRGSGDGGVYTTAFDVHALWDAFFAGRIVSEAWVSQMVSARSLVPSQSMRYGLGFWLHESADRVMLVGSDAGVSFRTVHDPARRITHTVMSNTSNGAWTVTSRLDDHFFNAS